MNNNKTALHLAIIGLLASGPAGTVYAGGATADPDSAASTDWRPRADLPPARSARLPSYCRGAYIDPLADLSFDDAIPMDERPVEIQADSSEINQSGVMKAVGNLEITQGQYQITADEGVYIKETSTIDLRGGVGIRAPGKYVRGEQASYDLDTGYFQISDADYLIHEREARGKAAFMDRPEESIAMIRDGTYTTCEPHSNAWYIDADEIELNRESGRGEAWHSVLRVQDVPVFYMPYFNFPIDDRRKSGFLYPTFSASDGGDLSVPYYLNLGPNYDMTITPRFIGDRGLHTEVETRHLNRWGQSVLAVGYIHDDSDYEDEYPDDDSDRWGLSFENSYRYSRHWTSDIDFERVSDDDYVSDLNRTLELEDADHLDQRARLRYQSRGVDFTAMVHGYQTIDSDIIDEDIPYERYPELALQLTKTEGLLGLDYDMLGVYDYFYRNESDLVEDERVIGHRVYLAPEISYPMRASWGYLVPSVNYKFSGYHLSRRGNDLDDDVTTTSPGATVDAGLFFDKRMSLWGRRFTKTLEPRLYYVYSDYENQDDIPIFDTSVFSFSYSQLFREDRFVGGDRIGDNNRLTAGLTTRWIDEDAGRERFRLSVGQVYYFANRLVTLEPGDEPATRGDSPYAGELILKPTDTLDLKVTGFWDDRDNRTGEGRTQLSWHTPNYDTIFNASHRYKRKRKESSQSFEQTDINAYFPLGERLNVVGQWMYDLTEHRTIGTLAGLEYKSCCWKIQALAFSRLEDEDDTEDRQDNSSVDHGFMLTFQLKGLSGMNDGFNDMLSESIIGMEKREDQDF